MAMSFDEDKKILLFTIIQAINQSFKTSRKNQQLENIGEFL